MASNDLQNIYPEQRHAGKIGYGPNFNTGAGLGDKLIGLAEEIRGKLTGNRDLVRHGHDVFSGESKRRKLLGLDDADPVFETGQGAAKPKVDPGAPSGTFSSAAEPTPRESSLRNVNQSYKEAVVHPPPAGSVQHRESSAIRHVEGL
ncbi:hypothetical protein D9613_010664 [Agrocybe pediades]|uniref:Uncharacterized protein n=1 Tax=Agrocybe pediades TaxID=84607 RepID=A0A8H4VI06_9AGAR|nr:hypothetical protein D9613_010664 [Agrocybe pediades]